MLMFNILRKDHNFDTFPKYSIDRSGLCIVNYTTQRTIAD